MKIQLIIVTIILLMTGFVKNNYYKPLYSTIIKLPKAERLVTQCSRWTPNDISNFWEPNSDDILRLENNFRKIKNIKSRKCCIKNWRVENLEKYAFQYIGFTLNAKRYIYINAFHLDNDPNFQTMHKDWKTNPIVMCDGGDYYWGALFDLDNLSFKDLAVNGL